MLAIRPMVLYILLLPILAYGEPPKQTDVHFGLPFHCGEDAKDTDYCLADKFKAGKTAVLIDTAGIWKGRTAGMFEYDHPSQPFFATRLTGIEKCRLERGIAVIGVEFKDVRLVIPRYDKSLISEQVERLALQILKAEPENEPWPITDSEPKEFSVGKFNFLLFDQGAIFSLSNNRLDRLKGWCTSGHVFFSVKNKLYFSYYNFCCGCGWGEQIVYDLSGRRPKKIYRNRKLSM